MKTELIITDVLRDCRKSLKAVCRILFLPTVAIAMSLLASNPVNPQGGVRLDMLGFATGNYFEYVCGPGRALVGIRGYTGVWIDNVQAVCARVDARGVFDARPEGPVFGGSRPINNAYSCPSGTVAAGLWVMSNENNPHLGSIRTACVDFSTRNFVDYEYFVTDARGMRGTGRSVYPIGQKCPAGTVAIGIRGRVSDFVDAFGLTCGTPKSPPPPNIDEFIGKDLSLQSLNYPDRYVRHRNSLGFIEQPGDKLGKNDATFKVVSGLAGRCVSFESRNYPNHFLRHQNFRLKLAQRGDDQLFRQDATFCVVSALGADIGLSFVSINLPDHYIRHRNNELWLDRFDGSELFRKDATFQPRPPLAR